MRMQGHPNAAAAPTDTAHRAWDSRWQSEAGPAGWLHTDVEVASAVPLLRQRGVRTVLELGCGVGRHACIFAGAGFEVEAVDASASGLEHAARRAQERGLDIAFREGLMTELPYDDDSFDYVLSFNVIYHGDSGAVSRAIAEIHRVLRPGGLFQGTMLSERNSNYGIGRQVAPGTFVVENGEGDKTHPHFYCDAAQLVKLFEDFELLKLLDRENERPGSYH
jgi:SAM-dependent methyltransferase